MKKFLASLDELYEMILFVKEYAEIAGFKDDLIVKIELAAEEALVNIIKYGYESKVGDIYIHCLPSNSSLKIIIKDEGIPYNPVEKIKSLKKLSANTKQQGGYGILFIQNMMDEVDYQRESNFNILTLVKYNKI